MSAAASAAPSAVGRLALVVTLKAKPGREAELENAFRIFIGKVRASGYAIHFQLTRTSTPGTYKLIEIFRDESALADHRATPHVKAFGATFGDLLDGPNQVEQLAAVE
jgi:quinol monooxygenase YgiN